jgi:hypothetical protein
MAATTAYAPTFTRAHRPSQAATATLAGLALATAMLAGPAWRARAPHPASTATHSPVGAPLARMIGAGDDPYEIQGNRRPDPLAPLVIPWGGA